MIETAYVVVLWNSKVGYEEFRVYTLGLEDFTFSDKRMEQSINELVAALNAAYHEQGKPADWAVWSKDRITYNNGLPRLAFYTN